MPAHGQQRINLFKDGTVAPGMTVTETFKKCVLSDDIGIGDCVQFAGSYISLQRSEDEEGQATFTWKATTTITRMSHWCYDTWQQSFHFITGDGSIAAIVHTLRGAEMKETFRVYPAKRSGTVNINPALWDQITQVDWIYEC